MNAIQDGCIVTYSLLLYPFFLSASKINDDIFVGP